MANYDIIILTFVVCGGKKLKLTVIKTKNSCSFYVQKTIRKENGSVTTVTVEKLGNIDEVKARANGMDPKEWAQNYVNELNKKEYDERKEIMVRYSPSKLLRKDEQKSFNIGYLFLQHVYYQLGLDIICNQIVSRKKFAYDLNDVLSRLVFTRILYPGSKLSSNILSKNFLEQPSFELHDIYRSLNVLAEYCDHIQTELFNRSNKIISRRKDILYYDCTNYFFEIEEEDGIKKYGKSKQHQPLPLVGMGLFMDYDGIPMAFDIYPGSRNEQPTLKPLENRIIKNYGLEQIIVCTDAGLCSMKNRKFNNLEIEGNPVRNFITTQPVKTLPEYLKDFATSHEGWRLPGSNEIYNIDQLDEENDLDKTFYKERWICEEISESARKRGEKPLEQHLIVSFSLKYRNYQRKIRQGQIERADKLIQSGQYKRNRKNQNDPHRFIRIEKVTENGEINLKETAFLDTDTIMEEARYDGFYAVCTNKKDAEVEDIIRINKRRWQIEECFRIMKTEFRARPVYLQNEDRIKAHFLTCFIALTIYRLLEKKLCEKYTCDEIVNTLKNMTVARPGEKLGYIPVYTRTDVTDALHETAGFRTDYEILNDLTMKKIIRLTKGKSK